LPSQAPVNSLIMQSIFALFHLTCALWSVTHYMWHN
jgi:hypothetical protein